MAYSGSGKRRLTAQLALLGGVDAITLTGNVTLTETSANLLALDPGGSNRNVTLPPEETNNGLFFVIFNSADAAENLVVKNDAGSTIRTLNRGEFAILGCEDGSSWIDCGGTGVIGTDFGAGPIKVDEIDESTAGAGITAVGAATASNSFAAKITGTINHATNVYRAMWSRATAITTARTGGSMAAYVAELVGLAGDTSGTAHVGFDAIAPTANGGSAIYVVQRVAAGFARLLDLSAVATGEALVFVGANLADAWTWGTATLTYSRLVTTTGTPGWLDTFTHTAAGQARSLTGRINHATANYSASLIAALQLTTARTGGQVSAQSASCTSLALDLNSVKYADYVAAAPTDGGGAVIHVAFLAEAGHDRMLDASALATAQNVYAIPTNVADAWNLYDVTAAKSYATVVSTTGSEALVFGERITTRDGVASGTNKVVGGRLTNSIVDSTGIVQAASGYSSFDVTASVPANTLKAGSRLKFRATVRISTILNGGATVEGVKLRLGAQDLITVHGSTAGAANTRCIVEGELTARAAPGAAVALSGVCTGAWSDTVAKITVGAPAGVLTFATNGALSLDLQISTSAAGDASGRMVLEELYTEVI